MPTKQRYDNDIYALAKTLGQNVATARNSLSDLAKAAAEGAAKGVLDEDDAQGLYEEYIKATEPEHKPTDGSLKGNISKLRQVIKAAGDNREVLELFKRVEKMHAQVRKLHRSVPLYTAFVDAARLQHGRRQPLSDDQIEKLCRWRWE
jgi:polyhydroxyalkanoate synthesis regulator phasin